MIKTILVDDEVNGAESLQILLQQYCKSIQILDVCHSAEMAIQAILKHEPDLVFLDIEMPNATGFDIVAATKSMNYDVIFTTAFEHYAIKALKLNAIDYLLKPIDVEELILAVAHVEEKRSKKNVTISQNQLEALLHHIPYSGKKIAIPSYDGILMVDAHEIAYFESDSNYTNVHIKKRDKILVAKTLKSFEDQLKFSDFIRVHNSFIVNTQEIDKYIKGDGGYIVMKDKTSIPVSRAHKQNLLERLGLH